MNGRSTNAVGATGASRTITLTGTGTPEAQPGEDVGILRLRADENGAQAGSSRPRRVVWTEETVDNEGLGRKKSKSKHHLPLPPPVSALKEQQLTVNLCEKTVCCIYHKPKAFDESSDESSSSSSDSSDSSSESESDPDSDSPDDGPNLSKGVRDKLKQRSSSHAHAHDGDECTGHHHDHSHKPKSKSKTKAKTRSSGRTQTITVTEEPAPATGREEDSDDDKEANGGFRPNAYERGPRLRIKF